MIANVENTIEWLRLNGLKYFVVQLKDTDNTKVFESDDGKPFEDNISIFRQIMNVSYGSRFLIKAADSKESKRGKYFEEFKNTNEVAPAVSGITQQLGIYGTNDVETIVQKRIEEYEAKQELKRIKEERDDYKKEAERRLTISEQFMETTLPYIGVIAQHLMTKLIPTKAQIALAGIEQTNEQNNNMGTTDNEITLTDDQNDRVESALQTWAKSDPDFITLLEKIASMAETKDPMYAMAKTMLSK